tara:strand:- start:71 stop:523 length:453 start_codon:yes stop_codon:yes gene_type:complete
MYLELIIEQNNEEDFQAKCPLFPKCKGRGVNKDEAIKKLCKSISSFISKQTSSFIQEKLLSKNYSEIVIDPSNKDTFQHRVINLMQDSKNKNSHKVFLKSLKPFSDNDVFGNFSSSKFNFDHSNVERLMDELEEEEDEDNLLFGISLCLN